MKQKKLKVWQSVLRHRPNGNVSDCISRVASSIPTRSHTFVKIDHEIISTAIILLSADSRTVVRYKRKYVHKELVMRLVKLAQEKSMVR